VSAPIFVVGTGRSGTTLLRFMLSAHPRIYITHEAAFYVYERAVPRRRYLDYYFQTPSFRWLRVDPARVRAALPDPLPPDRIGEAYAAVMREKAAQYGRARFGDKTPQHAARLGRIFEDFPDAKVVHIQRDPRDTAMSLSRMPWAPESLHLNARLCELERRQVAPFADRVLGIRLEDLLADPRATMGKVLGFVGEPWDDAVLDHPRHIPAANDMPPLPWLESAAGARSAPKPAWPSLPPAVIRMMERAARRVLDEGGYQRANLDREPGRLAVWWERWRRWPGEVRAVWALLRIAIRARDPRTFGSPRSQALWHQVNPGAWARYPGFEIPTPPSA
jgi:hypothetical protein